MYKPLHIFPAWELYYSIHICKDAKLHEHCKQINIALKLHNMNIEQYYKNTNLFGMQQQWLFKVLEYINISLDKTIFLYGAVYVTFNPLGPALWQMLRNSPHNHFMCWKHALWEIQCTVILLLM